MLQMHQNVQPVAAEPFPLGSPSQISKEQVVGIALCPASPKNKPWANEETKHGLKIHSRINRSHACRCTIEKVSNGYSIKVNVAASLTASLANPLMRTFNKLKLICIQRLRGHTSSMLASSIKNLCTKGKCLGSQASERLKSEIQTQINLTITHTIPLRLSSMFKETSVSSNRYFLPAELKRQIDSQASLGDLITSLNIKCDMVVNSTNHLCTKVKSLGSQAKGKLNSKIQTLINLAEAYSSTPKLRKKYKTSAVRSYRHFLAAELKSQIVTMYTKCNMEVNSTNHLCPKVKSRGRQAKGKLNSKIQTQINLTETYPITLKLTIYLQCNLRVLLIRIIKSAVATPGKKDFYDQVYHSKKGKLHKEIRRTKSQTYNVC